MESVTPGAPSSIFADPVCFARYFETVLSHIENDGYEKRCSDLTTLALNNSAGRPESFEILALGESFSAGENAYLLMRWCDLAELIDFGALPNLSVFSDARNKLTQALLFLERYDSVSFNLVCDISPFIVMALSKTESELQFGGASSLATWGMMCVNPTTHDAWYCYLPRLVHESSHNLLFAMAGDSRLVLNPPDNFYYSPIRGSERPMDGIYHAAFVSAQEVLSINRVIRNINQLGEVVEPVPKSFLESTRFSSYQMAKDCLAVVEAHGLLTEKGDRLLGCVRDLTLGEALIDY